VFAICEVFSNLQLSLVITTGVFSYSVKGFGYPCCSEERGRGGYRVMLGGTVELRMQKMCSNAEKQTQGEVSSPLFAFIYGKPRCDLFY